MKPRSPGDITELLLAWHRGDQDALASLTPLVYDELHRLAGVYMSRERPGILCKPQRSSTRPISG